LPSEPKSGPYGASFVHPSQAACGRSPLHILSEGLRTGRAFRDRSWTPPIVSTLDLDAGFRPWIAPRGVASAARPSTRRLYTVAACGGAGRGNDRRRDSGGGHRATLFGLGVLLYLADVGANKDVVAISSVSGGSLTNAFVGLRADYPKQRPDELRNLARELASQIANRGTLFAWWGTWAYLAALIVSALGVVAIWWLPWHGLVRLGAFLLVLAVWEVVVLRARGEICGRAYAATLFRTNGERPALSAIARQDIDHVICATHLYAGEPCTSLGGSSTPTASGGGRLAVSRCTRRYRPRRCGAP
jgi:hypothetical protein